MRPAVTVALNGRQTGSVPEAAPVEKEMRGDGVPVTRRGAGPGPSAWPLTAQAAGTPGFTGNGRVGVARIARIG